MASVYSTIQFLKSHGSVTHASETADGVLAMSWATHNAPCGDDDHWFEEIACFPIVDGNVSTRAVRDWLGY